MASITFIEHNGTSHAVDIPDGTSLMQGATSHNVPGIEADCGGAMTCATCRVCVPADWMDRTGAVSEHEAQMLEFSGQGGENVRLSCQIIASPELDGLCVTLPESQE